MRILFSCGGMEEYKIVLLKELEKRFNEVIYIEDYIPTGKDRTILLKLLRGYYKKNPDSKLVRKIYINLARKYYEPLLNRRGEFDYFLDIANDFPKEFLEDLKRKNPHVKTIAYFWDKVNFTSLKNNYKYFDYAFTFDNIDAKEYNLYFRPTFYIEDFRENLKPYREREIDVYYIGQVREKKRLDFAEKIYNKVKEYNLNVFIKLFKDRKNKNIEVKREIFLEKKISYQENIDMMKKTKVVLDLIYKDQFGLTLRCFEALATNTKIITNNREILNYDFYNKNNIFYLEDINDIEKINIDFFKKEYYEIDDKILERYSVKGFLDEIFTCINN